MPVYLVGGFVRDLILGVDNLDLDIVVEGDGISFAEDLASTLKAKLIRHRRFNTATVMIRPDLKIDIATARKEIYPQAASLPVVSSGNLRDDLRRRDFTINAMAIPITGKKSGKLIDFFVGKDDLRHKKIRILHDLSFMDDPTRILRAIRFEQRYNFRIEPETLTYLKKAVGIKMLDKVEPQRLRDELILVLKEKGAIKELRRINLLAGFAFISPHLKMKKSDWLFLGLLEKQIQWFKKIYPQRRTLDNWLIYLMGLLDSLKPNEVKKICQEFAWQKGETKRLINAKNITPKIILELSKDKIRPSRLFSLLEPLSYEAILYIKAKYKNKNLQKNIEDFLEVYNGMRICIRGEDLHNLGVAPGPNYKNIFDKVLQAKLEGRVKNREEELALIKLLIRSK
jgi:tRNA nucleotidyltransferase (CCA-adding enzyme)